jgi:hypothetical protein
MIERQEAVRQAMHEVPTGVTVVPGCPTVPAMPRVEPA